MDKFLILFCPWNMTGANFTYCLIQNSSSVLNWRIWWNLFGSFFISTNNTIKKTSKPRHWVEKGSHCNNFPLFNFYNYFSFLYLRAERIKIYKSKLSYILCLLNLNYEMKSWLLYCWTVEIFVVVERNCWIM